MDVLQLTKSVRRQRMINLMLYNLLILITYPYNPSYVRQTNLKIPLKPSHASFAFTRSYDSLF